jgi:hypothetical protein
LFYNDRPNRALKIKGKKHAREESSTKTDWLGYSAATQSRVKSYGQLLWVNLKKKKKKKKVWNIQVTVHVNKMLVKLHEFCEHILTVGAMLDQRAVNAVRSVAAAWNSTSITVTHTCFAKGDSSIESAVTEEEEDQNDNDLKELQGQVECPREFQSFS